MNEIEREEDDSINSNWRVLNKIQMTREHRGKEIQRKGYKEKDDSINSWNKIQIRERETDRQTE